MLLLFFSYHQVEFLSINKIWQKSIDFPTFWFIFHQNISNTNLFRNCFDNFNTNNNYHLHMKCWSHNLIMITKIQIGINRFGRVAVFFGSEAHKKDFFYFYSHREKLKKALNYIVDLWAKNHWAYICVFGFLFKRWKVLHSVNTIHTYTIT